MRDTIGAVKLSIKRNTFKSIPLFSIKMPLNFIIKTTALSGNAVRWCRCSCFCVICGRRFLFLTLKRGDLAIEAVNNAVKIEASLILLKRQGEIIVLIADNLTAKGSFFYGTVFKRMRSQTTVVIAMQGFFYYIIFIWLYLARITELFTVCQFVC